MINVAKELKFLGLYVVDKATGFKGVVTSIAFDMSGCVQALVSCGVLENGNLGESHWFDVLRLRVINPIPVIDPFPYDYDSNVTINDVVNTPSVISGPTEKPPFK